MSLLKNKTKMTVPEIRELSKKKKETERKNK